METTKTLAQKLRDIIVSDSLEVWVGCHSQVMDFDITSVDGSLTEVSDKSARFEVTCDDQTPAGVPCRRRFLVKVEMVEDSTADDA